MTKWHPHILPCGDTAFTIAFGNEINDDANAAVLALDARVAEAALVGILETVPTYRSLTVYCDPIAADPAELSRIVLSLAQSAVLPSIPCRSWRIPVVYGGAFGVDLDAVAGHHGLSSRAVIARHAEPEYRVAMLGFLPGYAYLNGLDPALALLRRPSPRPMTPTGTISIGGAQALVASIAAPSGWHLLGRTPVRSFMPHRNPIFLFEPGDRVRFEPIDPGRWNALDAAAAEGELVAERLDG